MLNESLLFLLTPLPSDLFFRSALMKVQIALIEEMCNSISLHPMGDACVPAHPWTK